MKAVKDKFITVRLDEGTKERVREMANAAERTISSQIIFLIKEAYKRNIKS